MNDADDDDYSIKPYDFGEHREIVNKILVAAFSRSGYIFDVAAGGREELETVDPLYMLQHAPGLLEVFTVAALTKKKQLSGSEKGWFGRVVEGLLPILIRSFQDDEDAKTQLEAIDKLLYPKIYELPKTVIKDLVERYHTRPALARGWRIRKLMGDLSWVVKPARANAVSVLDGAVVLDESEGKGHTIYSLVSKKNVPAHELAKRHWMRGVTLQNLAIRVYLEELHTLGFEGIDERALKRDMKEVEKWEQTLPPERRNWGILIVTKGKPNVHLPAEEYSDGWMRRKRGKSSKK